MRLLAFNIAAFKKLLDEMPGTRDVIMKLLEARAEENRDRKPSRRGRRRPALPPPEALAEGVERSEARSKRRAARRAVADVGAAAGDVLGDEDLQRVGVLRGAHGPAAVVEQTDDDARLGVAVAVVHHGPRLDRRPRRRAPRRAPRLGRASTSACTSACRNGVAGGSVP